MMKVFLAICFLGALAGSPALVADDGSKTRERETDPIYRELAKTIRGDDTRSKSARLQLAYAEESNSRRMAPVRKAVKTIDGKDAEVVFIRVPANSRPGTDFTMALLLTDGRVVDWASCWTSNREHDQELVLEDVDGDHVPDIGFRGNAGFWDSLDADIHKRRKRKPVWLATYSISNKGLRPIVARKERVHRLQIAEDKAAGPLTFRVVGLPESLPESDLCDCTVSVTNTSHSAAPLSSKRFFPEFKGGGMISIRPQSKLPATLQPGQTVAEKIVLRLAGDQETVTLEWSQSRDE